MRHSHQIAPRARAKRRPWYRPAGWRPLWVALAVSVAVHAAGLILLHRGRRAQIPVISVALYVGGAGGNGDAAGASGSVGTDAGSAGAPSAAPEDRVDPSAAGSPGRQPAPKSLPPPSPRPIARPEVARDPAPPDPGLRHVGKPAQRAGSAPHLPSVSSPDATGAVVTAHRGAGGSDPGGAGTGSGGSGGAGARGDLRGNCLTCPVPAYPRQARRHGWQGFVDLRLRLDDAGKVAAVAVERSSGFKVLDDAAVAAARRSRFRILTPVAAPEAWGRMRYRFEIGSG